MAKTNKNVGKVDMIVRIVLGLVAVYLGYKYVWYWYLLAVYLLITGIMGYCPIYSLFKKK